jgi:hypothetical protein
MKKEKVLWLPASFQKKGKNEPVDAVHSCYKGTSLHSLSSYIYTEVTELI